MRVVVTRSAEDASSLSTKLAASGFEVLEVPTIRITDAADGGAALRSALNEPDSFEWVVVTSRHGAARVAAALGDRTALVKLAVIGPATAAAARDLGLAVELVPDRFVAEGLLAVFPPPVAGRDRVLVAQADLARPVLVDGLRVQGWQVTAVEAYRTVAAPVRAAVAEQVAAAGAVAFTSASTVDNFLAALGPERVPPVVACIGPVTEAAARRHGLGGIVVADVHTLDGLVSALAQVVR
jgi:uroporphyrinogen III methyltransferase/synthase